MDTFPSEIRGYTPVCLCGRGAYGQVWLVVDAVGCYRALKIVSKSILGDWEREFKGLQNFQNKVKPHPNLIQVFHIEDCGSFFYYTMEVADNLGDEQNYIPSTLENWVKQWGALGADTLVPLFDQLLDGVEALHSAGLIHRDIKPDNIVFVESVPKLSDIGLVSSISQTLSLAGTQAYVPPEFLTGEDKKMKQSVDIYALGKTLYRAFSGQEPDNFPFVPHKLVANEGGKKLNALVKRACDVRPFCRLKSVAEFRSILHGNIGWWYDIKVFLSTSWKILLFPFRWSLIGLIFLWKNAWARITVLLLFIIWLVTSYVAYQRMDFAERPYDYKISFRPALFWKAMKQTLLFNMPLVPKYDLYDFYEKNEFSLKRHGKNQLVDRATYMKTKYRGLVNQSVAIGVEIGEDMESGMVVESNERPDGFASWVNGKLRRNEVVSGLRRANWELPADASLYENILTLPKMRENRLELKQELPIFYEVNLAVLPEDFKGSFDFIITAAEYPEYENDKKEDDGKPKFKPQMRFRVFSDGNKFTFSPGQYRPRDGSDEKLQFFAPPEFTYLKLGKRPYQFKIISASGVIGIYLEGHPVWLAFSPFYSGKFIFETVQEGNTPLQLSNFSCYDIGWANGEKVKEPFALPTPSKEIASQVKDYRWIGRALPNYGKSARRILSDEWYGVTTAKDNQLSPTQLKLGAGKHFLVWLKPRKRPCEYTFSIASENLENMLFIKPFDISVRSGPNILGARSAHFPVKSGEISNTFPVKAKMTLKLTDGVAALKTTPVGGDEKNASFWLNSKGGDYSFVLEADLKAPLILDFADSK